MIQQYYVHLGPKYMIQPGGSRNKYCCTKHEVIRSTYRLEKYVLRMVITRHTETHTLSCLAAELRPAASCVYHTYEGVSVGVTQEGKIGIAGGFGRNYYCCCCCTAVLHQCCVHTGAEAASCRGGARVVRSRFRLFVQAQQNEKYPAL